jgi:hypothetical protein
LYEDNGRPGFLTWQAISTLAQADILQVSTVLLANTQEMSFHIPLSMQKDEKIIKIKN